MSNFFQVCDYCVCFTFLCHQPSTYHVNWLARLSPYAVITVWRSWRVLLLSSVFLLHFSVSSLVLFPWICCLVFVKYFSVQVCAVNFFYLYWWNWKPFKHLTVRYSFIVGLIFKVLMNPKLVVGSSACTGVVNPNI